MKHLPPHRLILGTLLLAALFAPLLAPHDPMAPIDGAGVLGTDTLNRDHLSRLLYANRTSIAIALSGSLGAMFIGTLLGALLALGPKFLRTLLRMVLQTFLSVPMIIFFFLGIALVEKSGPLTLIVIFSATLWPESARLLEARISSLRDAAFVQVARMGGSSETRIFLREILPNLYQTWTISFLLSFISAALLESALGFLGLGQSLGHPSLGHMIEYGTRNANTDPHMLVWSLGILLSWIYCLRSALRYHGAFQQNQALLAGSESPN